MSCESIMAGYKNLMVWHKAMLLTKEVYILTENLPQSEKFGLVSQMRRCAVSVPSNIAEGSRRRTKKDFRSFLFIALGSCAELETQISIIKMLRFVEETESVDRLLDEVMRMLNKLQHTLSQDS